jgi:hypothetical protein
MPDDHDRQSCASFAVGYRRVLADLSPAQRGVMLKAIADRTPGLAGFLCHDIRDRAIQHLAAHSSETSISAVAKWTGEQLEKYATDTWPRDRDAGAANSSSELRRLQFDILQANNGATLSWRQILTILEKLAG